MAAPSIPAASQAAIEGRFLGGRPPYGYCLADAGPHPNPGKAAIGQRLHVLEPDPETAPNVVRIFSEFISGAGLYSIAEGLTRDSTLSPSGHDPARNRHRASSNGVWSKIAIRAILQNPRYTGYQVWNRQQRHEELLDVDDVSLGHQTKMRWNDRTEWIWSENPTHDPIISLDEFTAAQAVFTTAKRAKVRRERTKHTYLLSGALTGKTYTDLGDDFYNQRRDPATRVIHHIHQLQSAGYTVTLTPAA